MTSLITAIVFVAACSDEGSDRESGAEPPSATSLAESSAPSVATTPPAAVECQGRPATVVGTEGNDHLVGTSQADVIAGLGGDDVIETLGARPFNRGDRVCAGDGDDTISVGGRGRILGGAGDDAIEGGSRLLGEAGNDRLVARDRFAVLAGGSGSDTLVDERGPLRPKVLNQENTACVSYESSSSAVRADLGRGRATGEGKDRLQGVTCVIGTRFNDEIVGSRFNDYVDSGRGDDSVSTGSGADLVEAAAGDDVVRLGAGDDYAMGYDGDDRIFGDRGDDWISGWAGADHLEGGDNNDNLHAGVECDPASSYGLGLIDAEPNTLLGGNGNDSLAGDKGDDVIDGGPGLDTGHGGGTWPNQHPDRGADRIVSIENPTTC